MTNDKYRELKRQAKQSRIFFQPTQWDHIVPSNVPQDHAEKFEIVQYLGRTSYHNYGYTPNSDTTDKPWQRQNKTRASKLVHFAGKCRKENRNEAGWRSEVESRLLERFDIEVAW